MGLQKFLSKQQRVGWAWARQLALNEPSRPLGPEPRRNQLVADLIFARTKWGQ